MTLPLIDPDQGLDSRVPGSTGADADTGTDGGGASGAPGTAADAGSPVGRPRTGRGGHLARPRILVVGCGDVGLRVVALLAARFRIFAVTHSPERVDALRRAGTVPIVADLDRSASVRRLAGLARWVIHLAPPPPHGDVDRRTRRLLAALSGVERLVYVSTSGVYGDCGGAWIDETQPVAPATARARRRVDAERVLRRWAVAGGARLSILRVPGIYAGDRLPLDRLARGTPALVAAEDAFTNHVHADDLARIVVQALRRGAPQRAYHAVDDSAIRMGDWFDLVADAHGIARPERLPRAEVEARVGPALYSFMAESRRLTNDRLRDELRVRLAYPTVHDGLAAVSRSA